MRRCASEQAASAPFEVSSERALVQFACPVFSEPYDGFEGGATARFLGLEELFEDRHFDRETIVLCVRWYLRFKLSFRDSAEMMAKRGLSMAHTTIMR